MNIEQLAKGVASRSKKIKENMLNYLARAPMEDPFFKFRDYITEICGESLKTSNLVDMFIQSIACGLFTLKLTEGRLTDSSIERLMKFFSSNLSKSQNNGRIIENFSKIVPLEKLNFNELENFLNKQDFLAINKEFNAKIQPTDVITSFYEAFLKAYNPKQRIKRGIFHTPSPIASFIVRSIDKILRNEFKFVNGLAEISKFQIIDPASGTGTFLEHVVKEVKTSFDKKHKDMDEDLKSKKWIEFLEHQFLPNLIGFEILITPYLITQLRLRKRLAIAEDKFEKLVLRCYLANTLSLEAGDWKRPVSIVIGNPPYARSSANKGTYIEELMNSYKKGVRHERNIQPLSDDYIKFIRWAQELIDRSGQGIIGLVTNHTYLTGIVHTGMRKELMRIFDQIYILDLHGSKIRHEDTPEGEQDENLFDVKQGICIGLFVKNPEINDKKILHFDLFGPKDHKCVWLVGNDVETIPWENISNIRSGAPFKPRITVSKESEYTKFHDLTELFSFYNVGGKPGDDRLLVGRDRSSLREKIQAFVSKVEEGEGLGRLTEAKQKFLRNISEFVINDLNFERYNYRPFDIRWIYYDPLIWTRPVKKLKELCGNNLLLLSSRIVKDAKFAHLFVTNLFTDVIFLSNTSSVNCYVFPVFGHSGDQKKNWNLSPLYIDYLQKMGESLEDTSSIVPIAYVYAILSSNIFRDRYDYFLKQDFPRVPFIKNQEIYKKLVEWGMELINLHLNWEKIDPQPEIQSNVQDGAKIDAKFLKWKNNKLYINSENFFSEIDEGVWNFRLGKYQVCRKWLQDRKEGKIAHEDINSFCKIIILIKDTIRIIENIDSLDWESIWEN